MSETVESLAELIKRGIDKRLAEDVFVALPARVEGVDLAKQTITAKPLLQSRFVDEEGDEHTLSLPTVYQVPLVFPSGGGYRVTFPVAKGDTVLLVFMDRSLDVWKQHGGDVDPVDTRYHALADAVAIPGVRDLSRAFGNCPGDRLTLGTDALRIEVGPGDAIDLGGGSTKHVALAEDVKAQLAAIAAKFDSHTHILSVGTAAVPANPVGTVPDVGSTVVKVKA